jgi:hypothetical protein
MRRWACSLQLMLPLASAVILKPDSRGARGHILMSQIWDPPNLEGQVPVFKSPRNRVARLYPQDSVSPPIFRLGDLDRTHLLEEFCFLVSTVTVSLQVYVWVVTRTCYTCYLGNDVFTAICCNGNMITEPLSSNRHLAPALTFWLSGVMSQYKIYHSQFACML